MTPAGHDERAGGPGSRPSEAFPGTPPHFSGRRRTVDPDGTGMYADLLYQDGTVVEIVLHAADGRVVQRTYADEGAFKTEHAVSRFVWMPGDVRRVEDES